MIPEILVLCHPFPYPSCCICIQPCSMNSTTTQFVPSRRMGLYEPVHQMSMWGDFSPPPIMLEVRPRCNDLLSCIFYPTLARAPFSPLQSEDTHRNDQEASKPDDKVLRRLAQNREAARKSRLRKKAYVQQLENSKLRLIQLEQELDRARQQGLCVDAAQLAYAGNTNPGSFLPWLDLLRSKRLVIIHVQESPRLRWSTGTGWRSRIDRSRT